MPFSLPRPWPEPRPLTPQVSVQMSPPKSSQTPHSHPGALFAQPRWASDPGRPGRAAGWWGGASFLEKETRGARSPPPQVAWKSQSLGLPPAMGAPGPARLRPSQGSGSPEAMLGKGAVPRLCPGTTPSCPAEKVLHVGPGGVSRGSGRGGPMARGSRGGAAPCLASAHHCSRFCARQEQRTYGEHSALWPSGHRDPLLRFPRSPEAWAP